MVNETTGGVSGVWVGGGEEKACQQVLQHQVRKLSLDLMFLEIWIDYVLNMKVLAAKASQELTSSLRDLVTQCSLIPSVHTTLFKVQSNRDTSFRASVLLTIFIIGVKI
jgi:hypothetical protein